MGDIKSKAIAKSVYAKSRCVFSYQSMVRLVRGEFCEFDDAPRFLVLVREVTNKPGAGIYDHCGRMS